MVKILLCAEGLQLEGDNTSNGNKTIYSFRIKDLDKATLWQRLAISQKLISPKHLVNLTKYDISCLEWFGIWNFSSGSAGI